MRGRAGGFDLRQLRYKTVPPCSGYAREANANRGRHNSVHLLCLLLLLLLPAVRSPSWESLGPEVITNCQASPPGAPKTYPKTLEFVCTGSNCTGSCSNYCRPPQEKINGSPWALEILTKTRGPIPGRNNSRRRRYTAKLICA